MRIEPPKIDPRRFSDLVGILRELVPHYTPEWVASDEKDAGYALIRVFSHITEAVINRFNQVPRKNLVAFLDMLGINLLPAQPARVPITFRLAKGTDRDTLIPARIQAAADKTEEHDELPFETEGSLLATISNLKEVISVDPLKDGVFVHTPNVVSKDGEVLEEQVPFTVFSGDNRQEHALYLGHKELFNMESTGEITLEVDLAPGTEVMGSVLNLRWEYWGEDKEKGRDDWIALQVEEDETGGFNRGGRILLLKTVEGKVKEEKLEGVFKKTSGVEIKDEEIKRIKTRWLRCRLEDPLTPDSSIGLPTIDTIFLRARPSDPIPPDAGYFNDVPLDWTPVTIEAKVMKVQIPSVIAMAADTVTVTDLLSVDSVEGFRIGDEIKILRNNITQGEGTVSYMGFTSNEMRLTLTTPLTVEQGDVIRLSKKTTKVFPFGNQPRLYDAFYIGSQEAFSKKGAAITLYLSLARFDTSSGLAPPPAPKLSWEYWDGKGWQAVTVLKDDTDRFLEEGEGKAVEFKCPQDIEETEVSGQKNYWVRARIVGGDYGREEYTVQSNGGQKVNVERKYNLPIIRDLRIGYYFDIKEGLQHCLTYNNLDFQDKTSDSKGEGKAFQPFIRMEDTGLNLYMGFDRALTGGPIRLFFAAKEIPYTEETKPKMDWNYRDKTGWGLLDFLDETEGLIVQGHLEVIGPSDFTSYARFGRFLYWIRGSLVKGTYEYLPEVGGVYPNTTWALQAETIRDEILGSSDGEPSQTFSLLKFPVIEGQEIRVREVLSEEEKQGLIASLGEDVVFEVKDEKGKVIETWVLWTEVPDLFDSKPDSRHYTLDRATGRLRFGDGINGMIPPGGDDNIKAFSYQAGGGAKGNVKTGEIKTLKSAVPGVDKVVNNVGADGGADTATLEEMIEIGPAMISHKSRAVTVEDFEWLAKLASRKVVKARCLPNTNDKKQAGVGWVTVIIVPDSPDPKPFPSLELRRGVRRFLEAHSASTLGSVKHIYVDGPLYVEVGVSADVLVTSIDVASEVEREIRRKLNGFFHPLTGGPEGKGWDFGRDVSASDVYALLEGIEGVDHVENLRFTYNKGTTSDDTVEIKRDYLVSSGVHSINLRLRANGQINTGNEV